MWKHVVTLMLVLVITIKIRANSVGVSTDQPLYDEYSEEYYNESENNVDEDVVTTKEDEVSTLVPPSIDLDDDEEPIILSAGVSQVFSVHNKNPYKDQKAMKLLEERAGDTSIPSNCSQYKVS